MALNGMQFYAVSEVMKMTILRCEQIKKGFGELQVLTDVTLDVNTGDRIGLVGENGAGKTTLASIIAGEMEPDGGQIIWYKPGLRVGHLRQSSSYALNVFYEMATEGSRPEAAEHFFALSSRLGLKQVSRWDESRFLGLSGGEQTKLALASIWVTQPDVLILDEPTNHMDFQGVEWLAAELRKYQGAAVIISHDRYFLDQVVSRILELANGTVTNYTGNYSHYREEKRRRFRIQLHQYEAQQHREKQIEDQIRRMQNWSARAHREAGKKGTMNEMRMGIKEFYRAKAKKRDQQVKSRIKMMEKMRREGVEKPREEPDVRFQLAGADKRGRRIIVAENLGMAYPGKILFSSSSFYVQRGEKVGMFGPNGCGKTTVIRLLLQADQPTEGNIWLSPSLRPGYLSQDVAGLDPGKNALDNLGVSGRQEVTRARTLLANMGFDETMVLKPVRNLSLGEQMRIKLAEMVLKDKDLLILDEPTNHLDLNSRECLEATLSEYSGTLLLVTHDRYLLERVCDKMLVFENKKVVRKEHEFKRYWEEGKQSTENCGQQKMIIETRMAWLAGKLAELGPEDPEFAGLDQEYKDLARKKRELFR